MTAMTNDVDDDRDGLFVRSDAKLIRRPSPRLVRLGRLRQFHAMPLHEFHSFICGSVRLELIEFELDPKRGQN